MKNSNPSRKYVKTPVLIQDTYSPEEIAVLANMGLTNVYRCAKREEDPLPLRVENSKTNGCFALRDELIEWLRRNTGFRY